ncbi:MAG: preprotein translocase subunit SecE [Pseudolabrys sp.]|nr:preprotein translocase subunit SecE [Pseudolabrys sp.]MBV9955821.1 preprotein translocase subunit SecE [Pseudolabrys sp.]
MVSPFKFLQEVRTETQKVTWPSRRETMITTAMVFVMVAVASVFFLVADQVIRVLVTSLLDMSNWQANLSNNPVVFVLIGGLIAAGTFYMVRARTK